MSDNSSDDDGEIPFVTDNDDNEDSSANNGNTIAEKEDIADIPLLRNRGSIDDTTDNDDNDIRVVQIFTIDELLKLGL
jgi:hypothetical protein